MIPFRYSLVSSKYLTAVNLKISVFWDVMSCSLDYIYQLGGKWCPIFGVEEHSILQMKATDSYETSVNI
jgi:hypothetical protein